MVLSGAAVGDGDYGDGGVVSDGGNGASGDE